jgi:DNA-binding transcriptional LysR family regulator
MSRDIDPYTLRLFVEAAKEGSIGRTAEREHIAASALSRRIALLEHAIGVPLLERSSRGVALTDAGRIVFERGSKVDDAIRDLVRDVQLLTGQVWGTLRLFAAP